MTKKKKVNTTLTGQMDKKSGRTYVDSVIDWTMLAT